MSNRRLRLVSGAAVVLAPTVAAAQTSPTTSITAVQAAAVAAGATPTIPADYVFIPGGWTHPSCIHEVPNGAQIDEQLNVWVNGSIVAHYAPCAYTPIPITPNTGIVSSNGANGPSYGGWVEDMEQLAPSGDIFNFVYNEMTVPPVPDTQTPQTVYYFPGLESTIDGNCGILQPVLQWGASPAYSATQWVGIAWWWAWSGQFFSKTACITSPGDTLKEWIAIGNSECGSYCTNYIVKLEDTNTGCVASITTPNTTCQFNQAFPAVLEVDMGHPITSCTQVPSQAYFSDISLDLGPAVFPAFEYTPVSYNPTPQFPIGGNSPNCNWTMAWGSNDTFLQNPDE
jgi:hypothetical protein